jgi:beta-phosphoglucomutase
MIPGKEEIETRRSAKPCAEAVIFDMDGVIVDSESHHERAFLEVCHHVGMAENRGPTFSDYIGRSDAEFWAEFLKRNQLPLSLDEMQRMKRERVMECFRRERPFYPGFDWVIGQLARNYRLALASGSDREIVDTVLTIGDLQKYFEVTVTSSEVPSGKPRPDIFLKAAALMGVDPARCWVIEDSKPGVAAGLAAGMKVIAITNTHPAAELGDATHVVGSFAELEALLQG